MDILGSTDSGFLVQPQCNQSEKKTNSRVFFIYISKNRLDSASKGDKTGLFFKGRLTLNQGQFAHVGDVGKYLNQRIFDKKR